MSDKFTLVSGDGRPYITTTDRRALRAMLTVGATAAHTPRKMYEIKPAGAGDLAGIINRLQRKETGRGYLEHERRDAFKMLQAIEKERRAGHGLFWLCIQEPGFRGRQLFFA